MKEYLKHTDVHLEGLLNNEVSKNDLRVSYCNASQS